MAETFSGTLLQKLTVSGGEVFGSLIFNDDAKTQRRASIDTGETDFEVTIGIDVSHIKAILIVSDQDITLETNDGEVPVDTINLLANNPYVWYEGSYFTNMLVTDVTAFFFSNSSGATAIVDILVIHDSTPV